MALFTITSDGEFSGASIILADGSTYTVGADNPEYSRLVAGLLDGSLTDEQIVQIAAPFEAIYKTLTALSERVSRKGRRILFDGDEVRSSLADHIIKIMDEGNDEKAWKGYVRFMERLATNPSEASKEHLFHYIDTHGLTVTLDGLLVLYKGVRTDGTSSHAGYGIVDGVEYQNDHLPNYPGAVIEIPRSMVDDNRGVACSTGLHAGNHRYASSFAPRLLTVLVDPRDVVSVPNDSNNEKLRVCRYTVAEENAGKVKYDQTTVGKFDITREEDGTKVSVTEDSITVSDESGEAVSSWSGSKNLVDLVDGAITTAKATSKALDTSTSKPTTGSRVEEYKKVIEDLIKIDPTYNLKRYRSKRITAGRRDEFTEAAKQLGYKL